MEETTARDDWDEHWQRYAAAARANPAQHLRHGLVLSALKSASTLPTECLLDIGSGQGDLLVRLARAAVAEEYAGFELSESGVTIARGKLPSARILRVDVFAPPPGAAAFVGWATAATCSEVIEHVDEPVEFLQAARSYLADGASLILTVPGGPMSRFDRHIGHRRHYTKRLVTDVLTRAGFRVERVWLAGFPFFNLYRLMIIARGARLIDDVAGGEEQGTTGLTRIAMAVFDFLFRYTVRNSPFGWQIVAVAKKV